MRLCCEKNGTARGEDAFTLIELIVVMGIFVFIVGITGAIFSLVLSKSKQQTRVSETQIESIIGLELLRVDLEHAGYGLAWSFPQTALNYSEATADTPSGCTDSAATYNDTPNVPRSIVGGYRECLNHSDYLVIKSTVTGLSAASQRWTYITDTGTPKTWGADDLAGTDRVIALRPIPGETGFKQLLMNGTSFSTTLNNIATIGVQTNDLIYGVSSSDNLRMPFNRADYFVSATNVPSNCAPNTGVLQKVTINQSNGKQLTPPLPILDCVADFKVIFRLDMNEDGIVDTVANADGSRTSSSVADSATVQNTLKNTPNPDLLRKRLREVRIYILAHEGQMDRAYTHTQKVMVYADKYDLAQDPTTTTDFLKTTFDLETNIGANWQNYRWKVYKLVVKPKNLMEIRGQ